jgi:hypothetical protein
MSIADTKAVLAAYKTAIKTWVEAQTGIKAQWRDEEGGWQSKTRARLHLFDFDDLGVDVVRHNVDGTLPAGEDLVPTYSGVRLLNLEIQITSRRQDGGEVAHTYLRKLLTSLKKPSVRTTLANAGLAFAVATPTQDLTSLVDDRLESKATREFLFNAVENERDPDEADSYVETWKIDATFKDVEDNDHFDNGEEDYP